MIHIDLSHNRIDFLSGLELLKWVDYMRSMECLQNFNINDNPFFLKFPRMTVSNELLFLF